MRAFLCGLFVLKVALGFRLKPRRASRGHDGTGVGSQGREGTGIGSLYTFGNPKVSAPALTNPQRADGCFPGYRVVNEDYEIISDDMDIVTLLLDGTRYRHVKTTTVYTIARDFFNLIEWPPVVHECGWEEDKWHAPSAQEHLSSQYQQRAQIVPDSMVPNLAAVANLSLYNSYNHNMSEVATDVRSKGWGLVNSAIIQSGFVFLATEPSHLMQDPTTLRCMLTFEGSDDVVDWIEDAKVIRTPFCGLNQTVHSGFKNVVIEMVGSNEFQTKIRPQLQFCNKVDVMGHSLGGAAASLFAACASNPLQPGDVGYEEYALFGWTPATPKKLNYL